MNATLTPSKPDSAVAKAPAGRFRVGGYMWIFLAALALRGVYLWEALRNNELLVHPVVDSAVYVEWSRDILAGKWLWQEAINYTPMIPAWIAGITWLLGWNTPVHFGLFLLIAAGQAVLIGKTAELLWGRRVGLVTGWLAALYWPFIIFEASYFSEPFVIWNLTLALYLLVRWSQRGGNVAWVAWAGLHLAFSILARANTLLCLPVLVAWVMWAGYRSAGRVAWLRGLAAAVALALPTVLLAAPVAWWNAKLTGRPMLRTQGWVSVYVGNLPENRGIAIPVGVRWGELMYQPIRVDHIAAPDQEVYWKEEVFRIIRERTGDWLRLLGRKTLLLVGDFEISQEIDVGVFRSASRVLSLPVWPGWGWIAPLALVAGAFMLRRGDARRGLPLLIFAAAYLVSIAPVQVCGRYRLPMVVPLLPLAGFAAVLIFDALRNGERRRLTMALTVLAGGALVALPDWFGMRDAKIINHQFLIGLQRQRDGDIAGAERAFRAGLEWNPADPDCPLNLGGIALNRGDLESATTYYQRSRENFPPSHLPLLGLANVEIARGQHEEALRLVKSALATAPNNQDALDVLAHIHTAREDWTALALTWRQLRSYPSHPASVAFSEGRAWLLAGKPLEALIVYDGAAVNRWFSTTDRARALFLGGAAAHRLGQPEKALARWRLLAAGPDGFFTTAARVLTGDLSPDSLQRELPKDLGEPSARYVAFTLATHAALTGDQALARERFTQLVEQWNTEDKPVAARDVLEILALQWRG